MTNETAPHENGVADPAAIAALTTAVETATPEAPAEPKLPSFDDLGLHPDVKLALDEMGYFAPTPVQTAVYKPVSEGKDLLVQSRTGTGKTTAFGLPTISKVIPTHHQPQALILTPTRELALQVTRELAQIAKHRGIVIETLYGGAPIGKQITALKNGVHIVVGTPGRVLDHIGRRTLDCSTISTFILDECDEMLSMGFLEDIERVVSHLPQKKQTLLFSATMPDEVARYSRRHMVAPEQISLSRDSISVSDIHHAYYIVSGIARARDLLKIIYAEEPESAIIFCNMRDETTAVARFLTKQGLDAEPLSSDLSQADRERVMGRMKAKNLRFLCATDVAARGIDISNLSHVINYSVPESPEIYVHRTGRTGRAGKKGTALSMVGPRELGNFRYVRLTFGIKPEERLLPKDDIFIGRLKHPLPPIGVPQPPDPVQILIRGVPLSPTGPSELEMKIFEKLYATTNGRKVLATLVAERLDKLSTRSKPRRERTERVEGEAAVAPHLNGAAEARPEVRTDGGAERPRFDRDGGDRPRGDRPEGDRPRRFDGDRPRGDRPEGDRPRFDGDRPRGDRPEGDRPRRVDGDRPEGDRPPRAEGERPPRFEHNRPENRPEGDRPRRFDGDRPEGDRPPRAEGERERPPRFEHNRPENRDRSRRFEGERTPSSDGAITQPVAAITSAAPTAAVDDTATTGVMPAVETRSDRPEGDRGGRDRDRGGRDRDRGGRDRDRGGRDRHEGRDRADVRTEARPERTEVLPAVAEGTEAAPAVEIETVATKVDDVARAAVERADRGAPRGGKRAGKADAAPETREFWETWAEEKSTREPTPAAATTTAAPAADEASGETEERGGRSRGGRGRGGRDRDRGGDKRKAAAAPEAAIATSEKAVEADKPERPSRSKRDTTVNAAPPPPALDAAQARLFVSLGKKHGVSADDLRSLLAAPVGGDKARIGSVSLRDSHAHVRVPEELVDAIIAGVHGTQHNEQDVTVERARA